MSKILFTVLFAVLIMSSAAHSIDEAMKAYKNDKCLNDELSVLRPKMEEQVAQLKLVHIILFRTKKTLLLKLNSSLWSDNYKVNSSHVEPPTRSNPNSVMSLKLQELLSY